MTKRYLIELRTSKGDGYFNAQALAFDYWEYLTGSEGRNQVLERSETCSSRDENRAVSYALTELAAKISGGR